MTEIYEFTTKLNSAIIKNADQADPQVVGEEINRVRLKHGGRLSAEQFAESQKGRRAACHKHFEWNDTICGVEHRKRQAAELMRSVNIVYEEPGGGSKSIRAFQSVRDGVNRSKHVYVETREALSNEEMREYVFQQAAIGLQQWRDRYASLDEYAKALDYVDKALEEMKALEERRKRKRK